MSEDNKDTAQSDATSQNDEQNTEQDSADGEETVEALKEKLAKADEAKRQLTARAIKAEQALKGKTPVKSPDSSDEIVKDVSELKLAEKKRQFGYKHSLSPEETDKLFRFSGDGDPEETLKDPFFQNALKESRRQKDVEEATPSVSSRSKKVEGKTFGEMTEEERKKNWKTMTGVKS